MKAFLSDLASGLFFLAVLLVTKDIFLAAGVGIAVGVGQIAWLKATRQPVDPMQWMTVGMVIVMGGATLVTRNPAFVMIKASIAQACVGAIMLRPGWVGRYLPAYAIPLIPHSLVVRTGYAYAAALFMLAAANLVVALTASQQVWAIFNIAAMPVTMSVMGLGGYLIFRRVGRRNYLAQQAAGT
ncbi:MAG TPA: septation protein IspZ [Caulobacteraceae bacterium]